MGTTRVYKTSGQVLLVSSHGIGRGLETRKMKQAGAKDARIPPGLHRRTDDGYEGRASSAEPLCVLRRGLASPTYSPCLVLKVGISQVEAGAATDRLFKGLLLPLSWWNFERPTRSVSCQLHRRLSAIPIAGSLVDGLHSPRGRGKR